MADPRLVDYIRQHLGAYGPESLRKHLKEQGVLEADLEAALAEAAVSPPPTVPPLVAVPPPPPPGAEPPTVPMTRRRGSRAGMAVGALAGGLLMMGLALFMGRSSKAPAGKAPGSPFSPPRPPQEAALFHGSSGFIIKLPSGYEAKGSFTDVDKTMEVVYIYPTGTDPQHFINEGLYDHMGILRLEVLPRRVPQGFIGIDTLKEWVTRQLEADKASYEPKTTVVGGMPAFIVTASKPFQYRKAFLIGDKVRYTLVGGHQNPVFDEVLATLAETGPRDDSP